MAIFWGCHQTNPTIPMIGTTVNKLREKAAAPCPLDAMTDATWLVNQLRVHAAIWSKTMRLLLTTIILTMLAQPVWMN